MNEATCNLVMFSRSVDDTVAIGSVIGRALQAGQAVTLEGILGAGKTQLVRGIALGMGLDPRQVSSPTFVFMQEYTSENADRVLVHVDAYRLTGPEKLESIGWSDELLEQASLVVEWPSRIADALPPPEEVLAVTLDHVDEHTRRIEVCGSIRWSLLIETLKELDRDE